MRVVSIFQCAEVKRRNFSFSIYQFSSIIWFLIVKVAGGFSISKMQEEKAPKHSQSRADELEERLIDFAVRIIKLSANLPNTPAGKHIAGQIMRSGTSPAPNYGEARGAESHADFIHKLRIVLKELNETSIWLRVIKKSQLLSEDLLVEIIAENLELCKIFTSSLKTARVHRNDK